VLQRRTRVVPLVVASCCLLATATGCHLHRTGHGYILRGQWSLECGDTGCVSANGVAGQCKNGTEISARPAEQAQAKPELLAWRTRLKARLGARIFPQGGSAGRECPYEDASVPAHDSSRSAPPPAPFHASPENPGVTSKQPMPSGKTTELQSPTNALSKPGSKRPDLVME